MSEGTVTQKEMVQEIFNKLYKQKEKERTNNPLSCVECFLQNEVLPCEACLNKKNKI